MKVINALSLALILTVSVRVQGMDSNHIVPMRGRSSTHDYFDFSPELKTRQCKRTVELLQKCNPDAYKNIPRTPINLTFVRVPEIDMYFQVIIFMENKTANFSRTDLPVFCRRSYCVACLLKDSAICNPKLGSLPLPAYGNSYDICLRSLTFGHVRSGVGLCLTNFCGLSGPAAGGKCRGDFDPEWNESGNAPCTPNSDRDHGIDKYAAGIQFGVIIFVISVYDAI